VASRNAKNVCDEGRGVGETGLAVFLDFRDAIERDGVDVIKAKYGNLFQMYEKIVDDNPYETPMMIYPAIHYTMGGLWVDYNLMTTIPGLYATGECNFSDHGANRLGASALMQGLADGYFVIPYTIGDYLAGMPYDKVSTDHPEFQKAEKELKDRIDKLLNINGSKTVDHFHKQLGHIMWEKCGMSRNAQGLKEAKEEIRKLREEYWKDVKVLGVNEE
jgi:succinate dehydrogenase / fumarate reductase flavoprotein subunit